MAEWGRDLMQRPNQLSKSTNAPKRVRGTRTHWPWGWIVQPDDFIDLLKSVFSNHEGHVWLFNNDLAIIRNPKYFHELYEGYIRNKPQVQSVRIILTHERLQEFLSDQIFKVRFNELPDTDIEKFYFRALEDVISSPGTQSLKDYLKLFNSFEDQSIAFYTVGEKIIHEEAVTIIRPRVFPFVAYDDRGLRSVRGIAGQTKMLNQVAVDCAHLLESVFTQPRAFSQLKATRKRNRKEIHTFRLVPAIRRIDGLSEHSDSGLQAVSSYLATLGSVELQGFRVVGTYLRSDDSVRNNLRDFADQIVQAASEEGKWKALNNTLISGLPGQGKTAMAKALAAELGASKRLPTAAKRVSYKEFRLDKHGETELLAFVDEVRQALEDGDLVVALIDEIDAKEAEEWPLETLLMPLQWNEEEGKPVFWFAAGSKGLNLDEFLARLQARHKGRDFISRFPQYRLRIPDLDAKEMLVISFSKILFHAKETSREIDDVQGAALLYFAASADARQVDQRVKLAVGRMATGSHRLHYDNCFSAGATDKATFVRTHKAYYELLESKYVSLRG